MSEPILIARSGSTDLHLLPKMANRHGLITGATGTGKTVTLQRMAECFSAISDALCTDSGPMIVTYTSAIDRSSLSFTRVMLGMPRKRGSFSSRWMISISSC